ncbi:hypothetical protein LV457_06680 [Mycobacterium sp. MYCO198283]|uniref:hypothetical protein n=1 Tax=Mycobacterium sp. MYCO198283 TaxID=2883505 RepID=UPI001E48CDB8|nr:hypothetical protein [Mycobacterium sp. MYCO198283]MCG5431975.1 hypothetical protein [Mycobacterium sp. MYCO198283]
MRSRWAAPLFALLLVAGCSSGNSGETASPWVEDEVTFTADGLTLHGTYRHGRDGDAGPAAVLISESGQTDRNGDNKVAGKIGTMRDIAQRLSDAGVASLRYDKVGTGDTGLGPYAQNPAAVGSAVFTGGAKAAVRFLAAQPATAPDRIGAYGLGEGTVHALQLAVDTAPDAPRIHTLGLLQPLPGRYLDLITSKLRAQNEAGVREGRVTAQQADQLMTAWTTAVQQARTTKTVPQLPPELRGLLHPGNVAAVVESDAIDPVALARRVPPTTQVLLTCSDADGQAPCDQMQPLADALAATALDDVQLRGVNHVLKDDPTDSVADYANDKPLSPQFVTALQAFATR